MSRFTQVKSHIHVSLVTRSSNRLKLWWFMSRLTQAKFFHIQLLWRVMSEWSKIRFDMHAQIVKINLHNQDLWMLMNTLIVRMMLMKNLNQKPYKLLVNYWKLIVNGPLGFSSNRIVQEGMKAFKYDLCNKSFSENYWNGMLQQFMKERNHILNKSSITNGTFEGIFSFMDYLMQSVC